MPGSKIERQWKQKSMKELFEPIRLGPLTLKNRLVMTAMSTGFATPKGEVTERLREYYATCAAGGAALITVEETYIHPQLPHVKNALGIYGDHLIIGLRESTPRQLLPGKASRSVTPVPMSIWSRANIEGNLSSWANRLKWSST